QRKSLATVLNVADRTITNIHTKNRKAHEMARRADMLIAAARQLLIVNTDWVKRRATVINVGISPAADPQGHSRIVGDVDFASVSATAGAITPVPGGVGPMTIACLLLNTLLAACRRRNLPDPEL